MYSKMNISYIILIGFIILLYIDSSASDHDDDHHDGGSKCFSGDSLIQLSNGEYKEIGNLQSGDEITTIDQSKIISTEMIMMLDKQISKQGILFIIIKNYMYI
ncbi:unnamed protein product [Rotaria sordida]|uniref:Hedgehog protein Hint domain-containing protein n=1 Tax=Rotaria sordida TaxID=392033 RepID=A0A820DMN0_9BILA|nr:unnamed protein product [Rotaria sordida]